ncbi:cytochrome P450 4c3 isoform X1 [Neodiprion pinetum]|uniref:Cytochrome P450 4c3 isoform X1 n=1 Tax=Neodiprion lecontei TaxID=441921 RepID=A0A6J0BF22_NEOLC|nr:cytochrome P450 4c3 isoform X1 [Neodiprion lecontei]XP_046464960.1 cytochrome P450 4c3 isoform X1 [Neodiprion pinetum]
MNILLTAILTVLGWLAMWYRSRRRMLKLIEKIPGPWALPLLGNVIELNVDHDELFQRLMGMQLFWGRNEGINKAWLGTTPYVFLSKASTVEPILGSSRHLAKSKDYRFLQPWLGTGLLTSSGKVDRRPENNSKSLLNVRSQISVPSFPGKKWHSRRKILTPTFHFKILQDFVDIFSEQTEILVEKMSKEAGKGSFNIFPYITHCALDIICETAMGRRVYAQDDSESVYVKAVYEMGGIVQTRQATLWYHPDWLFRLTSFYKKHQNNLKILHKFSMKVISERRQVIEDRLAEIEYDKEQCVNKKLAFLDLLIEASRGGTLLSDEDIREEVDTFMFEGHDTTSSAMSWTLFLLGCHSEIQEKVVAELEEIFGEGNSERRPSMQDLHAMKYLERCIKEALRLYPSVPLLARQVSVDTKIGKYVVPRGTTAIIAVPMLHRDSKVFPNPECFDPDRFLPENMIGRHPYAYLPFSAGPRNCIGQKYAILEEKAVLSGVLRKYKIEAACRREDIIVSGELVTRAKHGLVVKITARKKI